MTADRPEDLIRKGLKHRQRGTGSTRNTKPALAALDALVRQRDDLLEAARDLTSEPFGCLNARAFYRLREVVAAVAAADAGPDAPSLPCGHPLSSAVTSDEGTSYCGECADAGSPKGDTDER